VIEGACRHLVQDRMGRTGARWSLTGAEAVLRLRALRASGDFDDYWQFHVAKEHERMSASMDRPGTPMLDLATNSDCSSRFRGFDNDVNRMLSRWPVCMQLTHLRVPIRATEKQLPALTCARCVPCEPRAWLPSTGGRRLPLGVMKRRWLFQANAPVSRATGRGVDGHVRSDDQRNPRQRLEAHTCEAIEAQARIGGSRHARMKATCGQPREARDPETPHRSQYRGRDRALDERR